MTFRPRPTPADILAKKQAALELAIEKDWHGQAARLMGEIEELQEKAA